jgi:DNA-binding CsgD family transcriptional regulator/PAS domain-containing protein
LAQQSDQATTEFLNLITALYGSLVEDEPWRGFLTQLRRYMGAKHATLIITRSRTEPPSLMITPTADPADIEAYRDHLFRIDPFTDLPEGEVVSLHEYLCDFKESEFNRDYLQYEDTSHILGIDLHGSSGFETRFRITRARGDRPFTREERQHCAAMVPHLRQAIEIYQRLETSRSEHAVYSGAIEQFAVGTIILDRQHNAIRYNKVAAAILKEKDGIALSGRRIVLNAAGLDSAFRTFLKEALSGTADAQGHIFRVQRPSGKRDLGIVARPVDTPDFLHAGSAPAVALFLGDPERQFEVTSEALRELFELTRTESRLAACLANGLTVQDSADQLGMAINTARAHLRAIYAKTGVCRQSQLVHLIHTSLPELAGGSRAIA